MSFSCSLTMNSASDSSYLCRTSVENPRILSPLFCLATVFSTADRSCSLLISFTCVWADKSRPNPVRIETIAMLPDRFISLSPSTCRSPECTQLSALSGCRDQLDCHFVMSLMPSTIACKAGRSLLIFCSFFCRRLRTIFVRMSSTDSMSMSLPSCCKCRSTAPILPRKML